MPETVEGRYGLFTIVEDESAGGTSTYVVVEITGTGNEPDMMGDQMNRTSPSPKLTIGEAALARSRSPNQSCRGCPDKTCLPSSRQPNS